MSNKSYAQLRAELLEQVDVDVDANAKLVSGAQHNCPPDHTPCLVTYDWSWFCCPGANADCCHSGLDTWCCPDGYKCATIYDEFGIPRNGCRGPNGEEVFGHEN